MPKLNGWNIGGAAFILFLATPIAAVAQTLTTLAYFGGPNGEAPYLMTLVQGTDGNFYGTTSAGGASNQGTVFRITPGGVLTTLYSFCKDANCADGASPYAGLVLAANGNFYGTTSAGGNSGCYLDLGCGTLFEITSRGKLTTLYRFCSQTNCADGANPWGGLIQATDGNFYGTTFDGSTVFEISPQGMLKTLADVEESEAGLVEGTDASFFGVAAGGYNCCGAVFKVTARGALTILHSFSGPDGDTPVGPLVQATNAGFYGTTQFGADLTCNPPRGCGTVFSITPSGELRTLHSFGDSDGAEPTAGLIQATDGNLYGTTLAGGNLGCSDDFGCGTIFQINAKGTLRTLHAFGSGDGAYPLGGLLQATSGLFYGTTWESGTVFSLDMGLGPFVTFVRAAGKIGETGGILGQGFVGTSSVLLDGIPANFKVISDTFIKATVPFGATTGYVTVTTPSGMLTSNVPFHVIQ